MNTWRGPPPGPTLAREVCTEAWSVLVELLESCRMWPFVFLCVPGRPRRNELQTPAVNTAPAVCRFTPTPRDRKSVV